MPAIGTTDTKAFFIQIVLYEHELCCRCVFASLLVWMRNVDRSKEEKKLFFLCVMMYNEDGNIYNAKFSHNEQNYKLNKQNSLNSRICFQK